MPRTPVYRLWAVSGDGVIFVIMRGVSALVARFLRDLRRVGSGHLGDPQDLHPVKR